MKTNTKIFGSANYEKALTVWYSKLNWMQRLEIMNLFDIKSQVKKFRACINHISENIELYA